MSRDQLVKAKINSTTRRSKNVGHGYDAFVSYSHEADGQLAPTVQWCLQRLAKPWYRPRALRVFRDKTNLAANPDVWATITTALQRSRYLILMASPEAAASPWVQQEVEYWQKYRERDTFLIALTDGIIVWDHAAVDFDWERTTALPPQLRGWFDNEPLWVDLSWARSEGQLSLQHARFRDAVATLAATIHRVPKDELDSEDIRQHRLATRLRWVAVTSLAVLMVISLILTLIAWRQANQKQAALEQVQSALRQTVSREVSLQSQALSDADPVGLQATQRRCVAP